MMSAETMPSKSGIIIRNLGAVFVIAVPIIFLTRHIPLPATDNFNTFSYLFAFVFVCIGLYALTGMLRGGKVMLHMGYHPISIFMIFCSGFLFIVGFYELAFEANSPKNLDAAIRAIAMGFGFGACHIARRSVCENGIWIMGSLIRWDAIKHVAWDSDDSNQIRYEKRGRWILGKYGIIAVPEMHRAEFETLVAQHVDVPHGDLVTTADENV